MPVVQVLFETLWINKSYNEQHVKHRTSSHIKAIASNSDHACGAGAF